MNIKKNDILCNYEFRSSGYFEILIIHKATPKFIFCDDLALYNKNYDVSILELNQKINRNNDLLEFHPMTSQEKHIAIIKIFKVKFFE